NPFFVQQVSWLLKAGQTGIPPGVREALAERFAALSTACTAALGAAAVIGGRFRADLVARTLEQAPEPVAEALAEGARAGVLARARWRMGAGQAAGETYLAAARLARREHDAVGLAHAALGLHEIGSRIWWPADQLVTVLSEALDALSEASGATALRLRVMAGL